jgi:uncharacterized protein YukE
MEFEVDSDELRKAETSLSNSSENFNNYLTEWRNEIETLKTIWSGELADVFYTKMEDYLSKLDLVSETTQTFSNVFNKSYTIYETKDDEFQKELDTENKQYETVNPNELNDNEVIN